MTRLLFARSTVASQKQMGGADCTAIQTLERKFNEYPGLQRFQHRRGGQQVFGG